MPCEDRWIAFTNTASILTAATPQGDLVAVTQTIADRMNDLATCVGDASAFPANVRHDVAARIPVASVSIQAVADDALRLQNHQIPAGDRLITEGPAIVLSTNVRQVISSINPAWFA